VSRTCTALMFRYERLSLSAECEEIRIVTAIELKKEQGVDVVIVLGTLAAVMFPTQCASAIFQRFLVVTMLPSMTGLPVVEFDS
jgi:hypothetical protein